MGFFVDLCINPPQYLTQMAHNATEDYQSADEIYGVKAVELIPIPLIIHPIAAMFCRKRNICGSFTSHNNQIARF